MTLHEILEAIDKLSWVEVDALLEHIRERREHSAAERIQLIEDAVSGIRDGLSEDDLSQMTAAMNIGYV
jgi:ribosomal protein L7/L12